MFERNNRHFISQNNRHFIEINRTERLNIYKSNSLKTTYQEHSYVFLFSLLYIAASHTAYVIFFLFFFCVLYIVSCYICIIFLKLRFFLSVNLENVGECCKSQFVYTREQRYTTVVYYYYVLVEVCEPVWPSGKALGW